MAAMPREELYNPDLYLSPDQQDLLVAALASNNPTSRGANDLYKTRPAPTTSLSAPAQPGRPHQVHPARPGSHLNAPSLQQQQHQQHSQPQPQPQQPMPEPAGIDDLGLDGGASFGLDFDLDFDDSLEYEGSKHSDEYATGDSQGRSGLDHEVETHDKRKNPDDARGDEEGGGKRREGDDKTAKKPGRKPLTSEPTSKRKAQNRAAQRAFRERKEKHLKDLEVKVADLEKASESANHENGLLRAQVARLQEELKEYRKRMSASRRPGSQSSPASSSFVPLASDGINNHANFQFDFPRFGGRSELRSPPNASSTPSDYTKESAGGVINGTPYPSAGVSHLPSPPMQAINSSQNATSPSSTTPRGGVVSTPGYAQSPAGVDARGNQGGRSSIDSPTGLLPMPQLTQGSFSSTASPSASSVSHHGPNSSACTSPESYNNNSPVNSKPAGTPLDPISEEFAGQPASGGTSFGRNDSFSSQTKETTNLVNSIDWLAQQNGGQFDPVLFGDYREPQDAIVSGDYGFFNDAFPLYDFSPFGDGSVPSSGWSGDKNVAPEVEPKPTVVGQNEGSAEVKVPVNCNDLWEQIQSTEQYQKGELDIDSLCADMQKKAKCSETGIVFDQNVIDTVIARYSKS